jgi:hypothetical protein
MVDQHSQAPCAYCSAPSVDVLQFAGGVQHCNGCGFEWSASTGMVSAIELLGISQAIAGESPNLASRVRRAADEFAALERPTEGALRILIERRRQIEQEPHTPESDIGYTRDELAKAAACYALPISDQRRTDVVIFGGAPEGWPFPKSEWKPAPVVDAGGGEAAVRTVDRIRELEKAGALIAAEIDRLLRLQVGGDHA